MRFSSVSVQNFLSFGDEQTIDLRARGLVAVFGRNLDSQGADSNGAGKSTILEAIVWALYGETMRGYKADEVVNRSVGANCRVRLYLEDDGRQYLIDRTRKLGGVKKPNDVRVHTQVGGVWKEVSEGTNADTQEQIQTIVGMDLMTFTQSVMLRTGSVSFSAMTDKQQKEVLENILQTHILSAAQVKVKDRTIRLQQEMAGLRAGEARVETQINDAHIHINKLTQQRDQHAAIIENRRKELVQRRVAVEVSLDEAYARGGLGALLAQQEDQGKRVAALEDGLRAYQERALEITRQAGEKQQALAREEGMAVGRLRQLSSDLQTIDQFVGKSCPTCKQVLNPDAADVCMQAWGKEAAELQQKMDDIARKRGRIKATETKQLSEFSAEKSAMETELSTLRAYLRQTTEAIQKRNAELKAVCDLEQQVLHLDAEILDLDDTVNPFQGLIDQANTSLLTHETALRSIHFRIHIVTTHLVHLNYWLAAFSNQGLRSYVLDSVVPFLTSRAQYYADTLSGGDLKITFSTQTTLKSGESREQFQVSAHNRYGADVYHGNSDGEKGRVDIAVGWALGDLAAQRARKPVRFKGLDEPFTHLDETGEDAVVRLLHKEVSRYETILCITHSAHLQSQFQNQITVRKKNGVSVVL